MKLAESQNNNKKDRNSHKTRLVFVHGKVFKGESKNSAIVKMELFATIGNGRAYNKWTAFAHCCSNLTIFNGKIKTG